MNDAAKREAFRRILVALDASAGSLATLEIAAGLAASLQSELLGLFVEDADLVNLATLPFSQEVSLRGAIRRLDPAEIEQEMKRRALAAEHALQSVARRRRVSCSFRVTRGHVGSEIAAAAGASDLLCIGPRGRPMTRRAALGDTARLAAGSNAALLLLNNAEAVHDGPVLAVFDGSAAGEAALRLGIRIARGGRARLVVVLPAADAAAAAAAQELAAALVPVELAVEFTPVVGGGAEDLLTAVGVAEAGLVVTGAGALPGDDQGLDRFVAAARSPVLLLRPPG